MGKNKEIKNNNNSEDNNPNRNKENPINDEIAIEKEQWEREQIQEDGKITLNKGDKNHSIQLFSIIGEIEGHDVLGNNVKSTKYEHILPMLASIEDSDEIQGVLLLLNTMGGDVEAGLAIAEMIASLRWNPLLLPWQAG